MNNLFRPSSSATPAAIAVKAPWRVLVVDDDEFIHQVTELVLSSFKFEQRPLELVRAYSAAEATAILEKDRDFAVALIDVVMETEDAGLQLVKHIREQMAILTMRIILRTGQPGQAPEFEVIEKYEINDYKDKTELTAAKLRTVVIAALRGYRDLLTIESHRRGLMRVIQNTSRVLASSSLHEFATCVLQQVVEVIDLNATGFYCVTQATGQGDFQINHCLAATADWVRLDPSSKLEILPQDVRDSIQKSLQLKTSVQTEAGYVAYHISDAGYENVLYLQLARPLTDVEQSLLSMYCSNVALTYQMLLAKEDIIESQHEMAYMLGEAVEQRSKETGMHVRRVALYVEKLALLSGLSEQEATLLKRAAPLHDVGKVSIPDHILHKPGKLESDEWELMKQHAVNGAKLLGQSGRTILQKAAEIALTHHEKWDGSGYPAGLAGTDIPLSGRIVALADVFDALAAERCYKPAWPADKIQQHLTEQAGKHFDPALVTLFMQHEAEFYQILHSLPDTSHA